MLFAFGLPGLGGITSYNSDEMGKLASDIRGLRAYRVSGLKAGSVGGKEFHRIRVEIFAVMKGRLGMEIEDVYAGKKTLVLGKNEGALIHPFMLHTYNALEEDSSFLVLANTLFDPAESLTHDTYSAASFRKLQERFAEG